jgi:hypothetical protein
LIAAVETGQYLEKSGWPYCFIGGVAYQRWGEPRQTMDVDGVLLTGFGNEEFFVKTLTNDYQSRVEDPIPFAVQNRIVLLKSPNGVGIDLSLGGLPFEERMVERSSVWYIPEHGDVRTCSAEDLVVLKTIAARPQDWIDVENTIIRQGTKLDRNLIQEELLPLLELKEEPKLMEHLNSIFAKINSEN